MRAADPPDAVAQSGPPAPPPTTSPSLRHKRPRPPDLDTDPRHPEDPFQHEDGDEEDDEDDDDGPAASKKADKKAGRRKIKIEFIQDKSRRHITFSKRKAGIMKKVGCCLSIC